MNNKLVNFYKNKFGYDICNIKHKLDYDDKVLLLSKSYRQK